jgi:hypothetical protein
MGWTTTRAMLASRLRIDPNANVDELRTLLRTQRLSDRIKAEVDKAPPLTAAQRESLAALLRTSADDDTA